MLLAHGMKRSQQATFDQSEERFGTVHPRGSAIRIALGVFLLGMVHDIMPAPERLGNRIKDGVINSALIGVDDGAIFNVFKKKMAHIVLRHLRNDLGADMAATFHHCDDRNFIGVLSIAGQHSSRIAWSWFSAHKSLIHLADAGSVAEFLSVRLIFSQREANPVHEKQSRLVGDLTVALNLPGAHALLAGANAPEPIGPMPQRQL